MSDKKEANDSIAMTDGIKSVRPYVSIHWVCDECKKINIESFYKYRTQELFECRDCEHCYRLGDIN